MKNMTEGSPLKLIILFMIPILLGNIFQQIYILSDLYILGRYLGLHALAVAGAVMLLLNYTTIKVKGVKQAYKVD